MGSCERIIICSLLILISPGCASFQIEPSAIEEPSAAHKPSATHKPTGKNKSSPKNTVAIDGKTTEVLRAAPPHGWHQIYQLNNDAVRLADFVPQGQTNLAWKTKLSFESHSDLVDLDPIEILLSEAKKTEEKCSFIQHFNFFSGYENNYPTSLRLIMCGENEHLKKGELSMLKVIKGEDFLYIIRFLKRITPFKVNQPDVERSEIATWSDYLRKISLCNTADPEHPC